MIKKTLARALSSAAFVAAAAFFWGTTEAALNYFWRPGGTWWGNPVWESAFRRSFFYAFVVLTTLAVVTGVSFLGRLVKRSAARRETNRRRGAVAGAAIAASGLGWFLLGLDPQSHLNFWFIHDDFREPEPFFIFWGILVFLAAAAAALTARFVARRKWWRATGKVLRAIGAASFAALLVIHVAVPALKPVPRKPNVVLIVLDAWRADTVRDSLMPNLTAYAAENATVYTRVWSCASWTYPSMASLFSGRYPDELPLWKSPRTWKSPTVAQVLRNAGYETAAFVGNAMLEYYSPITAGFDHYVYWDWNPFLRTVFFYDTNWFCPAVRKSVMAHRPYETDHSRTVAKHAAEYLSRPHRRPFFMWTHFMDPHSPYTPPPGYYLPRDEEFTKESRKRTPARRFAHHRLYEAECAFLDDLLAAILKQIAPHENTIVILTSDHGEEFWEHETYGHGKSVYETVTRVPLIISVPGREPGVVETPTTLLHLAPTILDLVGVEVPASMTGKPLSQGQAEGAPELIFVGSRYTLRPDYMPKRKDAVILWPWKLHLRHDKMVAPGEYYDLREDPGEFTPLPEDELARGLRKKLRAWKKALKKKGRYSGSPTETIDAADLKALGYI